MEKGLLLVLFLAIALFVFLPENSFALTAGPSKMEYFVDPGDVVEKKFSLFNDGSETRTFYPIFENFTEENGQKVLLEKEGDLADWIKTETSVTLTVGEKRDVPFRIEIPKDASPGGHFAIVWWSTAPPKAGQVAIVTRVGLLLFVTVSGDIVEQGKIISFSTLNPKRIWGSFPVEFALTFSNEGNVHLKPKGQINIKNIFGKIKSQVEVNAATLSILPKNKRTFNEKWQSDKFTFGLYKAELNLTFGQSQKRAAESFWFFFAPWKTLLLVILGLLLIGFAIPQGIKKYNRWIISKAQKK